jgi:hypothetical protein
MTASFTKPDRADSANVFINLPDPNARSGQPGVMPIPHSPIERQTTQLIQQPATVDFIFVFQVHQIRVTLCGTNGLPCYLHGMSRLKAFGGDLLCGLPIVVF